MYDLI